MIAGHSFDTSRSLLSQLASGREKLSGIRSVYEVLMLTVAYAQPDRMALTNRREKAEDGDRIPFFLHRLVGHSIPFDGGGTPSGA